MVEDTTGKSGEIVQRHFCSGNGIISLVRGQAADLAQLGQEAPGVVRLARVIIAIDHKPLSADIVRLKHLDIILVFKSPRISERQEMTLL